MIGSSRIGSEDVALPTWVVKTGLVFSTIMMYREKVWSRSKYPSLHCLVAVWSEYCTCGRGWPCRHSCVDGVSSWLNRGIEPRLVNASYLQQDYISASIQLGTILTEEFVIELGRRRRQVEHSTCGHAAVECKT